MVAERVDYLQEETGGEPKQRADRALGETATFRN